MSVNIRPGISVRPRKGGGLGTLGAIVRSQNPLGRSGRKTFLLSCSHVLAPFGVGEDPQIGDEIIAPEITGAPLIGKLSAFTMSSPTGEHMVDAALAEVVEAVLPNSNYALPGGLELPITGKSNAVIQGLDVFEKGKTDGNLLRAKVGGFVQTLPVNAHTGSYMLSRAFGCARVSSDFGGAGDSGAIVFNKRGRALGLQVAQYTPVDNSWALACPIVDVLRALEADYKSRHGDPISLEIVTTNRRMELPDPRDLGADGAADRQQPGV